MELLGKMLVITALLWLLVICIQRFENSYVDNVSYNDQEYNVIVVDSCEYLYKRSGYRGYFAHKGNCKYCIERQKKLMGE